MTAILLTGTTIVLVGAVVLLVTLRVLRSGTQADESRAQAWQDDGTVTASLEVTP